MKPAVSLLATCGLLAACGSNPKSPNNNGQDGDPPNSSCDAAPGAADASSEVHTGGPLSATEPPAWPNAEPWVAKACDGASVLCVSASASAGGNGLAATPFSTIAAALDAAEAGATILVAAGEYKERVEVTKPLSIYGGFSESDQFQGRDIAGNRTTIDGEKQSAVVAVRADEARVDGFKLTNGSGACDEYACNGGGVYIEHYGDVGVVIANNEICENRVEFDGGGNSSRGGGVYTEAKATFIGNFIHHNTAERGGGVMMAGATLIGNRIEDNTGYGDHGGGVAAFGVGNVVRGNYIARNEIGRDLGYGWAGGILIAGGGAELLSEGNVYYDNYAANAGSGVFVDDGATATLRNDFIIGNRCGEKGAAGIMVDALDESGDTGSVVDAQFLTIVDQKCAGPSQDGGNAIWTQGAGTRITLRDSIVWGNDETPFANLSASVIEVKDSLVEEATPGDGNFVADPLFADAASGDYHVKSKAGRCGEGEDLIKDDVTSPSIDKANEASDFSREPAPNGGRANLGAYGNTAQASRSE